MTTPLCITDYDEQITEAIMAATFAHHGQKDKAGMPYIFHPLAVAMNFVGQPNEFTVAVLHDVLEDCKDQDVIAHIRSRFSPKIVEALDAISKKPKEPLEEYWARCKANPLARVVKLRDIAHNSSPERLNQLSRNEQEYLKAKYERAKKAIE